MKFYQRFINRLESDRGDSLVTALIVFPLVFSLLMTGIDFGLYLNNKSAVTNAARDGARTVAILGGNDDTTNEIYDAYGISDPNITNCAFRNSEGTNRTLSTTECQVMRTLEETSLVQVEVEEITCAPERTSAVGERVNCRVDWHYMGLPGSSLNLISLAQDDGKSLGFTNNTIGWANAETSLQG